MSVTRPAIFWIAALAAVVVVVALLREALLPFVAGMVVAYLLDPLATRMEQLGMNRLIATLVIVVFFFVGVITPIVLAAPVIVRELADFVDDIPLYVRQLQGLATDTNRPWLSKIVGEGLGQAEQSFGELTSLATDWVGTFLRSVWSGGRGLISVLSLLIVTPIVACYLVYDWNEMIAVVDHWVPPTRRDIVRSLAREVDTTIRRFVLGQGALCIVLGLFYMVALSLIGLKHGLLIGLVVGLISFVPYLGSLTGLVVSTCVAIAEFWPKSGSHFDRAGDFLCRSVSIGLRAFALSRRPARQLEPCLGDVRTIRVRASVRFRWSFYCGAARCGNRRAHAFRIQAVLRQLPLRRHDGIGNRWGHVDAFRQAGRLIVMLELGASKKFPRVCTKTRNCAPVAGSVGRFLASSSSPRSNCAMVAGVTIRQHPPRLAHSDRVTPGSDRPHHRLYPG